MYEKLIASYEHFDLVGVYQGSELLYKTAKDKPLPSEDYNRRLIRRMEAAFSKPTAEELKATADDQIKLPPVMPKELSHHAVRRIRIYASQGISRQNIAAMYDISIREVKRIVDRKKYANVK